MSIFIMLYTHDLRIVSELEHGLVRTLRIPKTAYLERVATRYAAVRSLKYPDGKHGSGARVRDTMLDAMRLDAEKVVEITTDPVVRYVDLIRDRAKVYAWWYALVIDPVVWSPFDETCTGSYVDALRAADDEDVASLEELFELSSRYFTHAEQDRCMNELRVAIRYLHM